MLARDRDNARVRRWILLLYAGSALLMAPALTSPLVMREAVHAWWGWTPVPGPGLALYHAFVGGSVAAGLCWAGGAAHSAQRSGGASPRCASRSACRS